MALISTPDPNAMIRPSARRPIWTFSASKPPRIRDAPPMKPQMNALITRARAPVPQRQRPGPLPSAERASPLAAAHARERDRGEGPGDDVDKERARAAVGGHLAVQDLDAVADAVPAPLRRAQHD